MKKLKEIADFIQARLVGDESVDIEGLASIRSASPGDLVFVGEEKHLEAALHSKAAAVIAGDFAAGKSSKPLLIAQHPRLAFARAGRLLGRTEQFEPGIHSNAVVHSSAKLGPGVSIEALVIIRESVIIGARTHIGPGCCLQPGVVIGDDCHLVANVTIYSGARLGNRVIVHAGAVLGSDGFGYVPDPATGGYEKFPQIGTLEIEDDVEIGANSTIDRGALDATRIRRGTKIDNLVHIGHNCEVGEDVVIAAQTGLSGSVIVEDDVIMGGQVGIGDHARIESGAILGAQTGVPSNKVIRGKGVVFWGTPARPIREYLKELAILAQLAKKRSQGSAG
jgi:UDP-3-O-[3-hydroxymyristoyl] glucosamine N-acyltransferase